VGWSLTRYVVAATLARGADAGAPVAFVLLAVSSLPDGARIGGLLAVGLTAPHALGPVLARRLDRAGDGRRMLAAALACYAAALAGGALALGRAPLAIAAAAVVGAGACGPLLTGGLSSRLAGIAAPGERAQRRTQGWDAVTYGVGGTAGPGAVAALAGLAGPLTALCALAGCAAAAAVLTLALPAEAGGVVRAAEAGRDDAPAGPLPLRAVLRLLAGPGPLRRVTVAATLSAASFGAVPAVIAVVFGAALHGSGAALSAAFGLGTLAGSLLVTAVPLRGEPEALTRRAAAATGAALALCAVAPSYPLALGAFALAGVVDAPLLAATLAARAAYAPDGARAQVFVTLAAAKSVAAAGGAALSAAAIGYGPRALLAAGAALTLAGAAIAALDRAAGRTRAGRSAPVPGCALD
jgi:hypothetical protein